MTAQPDKGAPPTLNVWYAVALEVQAIREEQRRRAQEQKGGTE